VSLGESVESKCQQTTLIIVTGRTSKKAPLYIQIVDANIRKRMFHGKKLKSNC
jgi:hypothetical protein